MSQTSPKLQHATIAIAGMTCGSCEILLERKLKAIPGVLAVAVDHQRGTAVITADTNNLPSSEAIEEVIQQSGYSCPLDASEEASDASGQEGILHVCIDGMTCTSCERLLRGKLKMVPGVATASVHYRKGTANVYYKGRRPLWDDLKEAVESAGYQLRHPDEKPLEIEPPHRKWTEIGGALLVIFALYKLLQTFDVFALATSGAGATTLGGIFVIGLVAGTSSCLAVTGGLLLSVAAKYNEVNQSQTRWQKFKPLLHFNIGRLASYFVLGGLVGIVGKSITLTPTMTGYMNITVALVMLYLALSILKIIPKGVFPIRPPKRLSHWIASLSENPHPAAPFSLGALTFFLPCGFTQSLQLIALASGNFLTGALTMFTFALGTLPALLGVSAISSTAKGTFSRLFFRFSGTLVLLLALWNGRNGLLLVGVDVASAFPATLQGVPQYAEGQDPNVTLTSDGQQIINLHVTPYGYDPKSFTIAAGKPTWIHANTDAGIGGCTSGLALPPFRLATILKPGAPPDPRTKQNILGPFTPTQDFRGTCAMGMLSFLVRVEGATGPNSAVAAVPTANIPSNAQVVRVTWTRNGYEPRTVKVKTGKPTALLVSADVPTGGCMSFLQFREFDQATQVPAPGEEPAVLLLATDQAQPGRYPGLCSMGSPMVYLEVEAGDGTS